MALEAKLQQETSNNSVCIALDDKTRVDSKNIIKINLILLSKKVFPHSHTAKGNIPERNEKCQNSADSEDSKWTVHYQEF